MLTPGGLHGSSVVLSRLVRIAHRVCGGSLQWGLDIARTELVTALSSKIGYDKAAETAHTAYQDGSSL
jgi:Fumarase C C-terminus